jgi:GTP-dependent phosphoenolpyruvate carboxykinase
VEHIIEENKERFPQPYRDMANFALQTFLSGSINNSRERVRRNYNTAIPQYYRGRIQLLLPLCISNPHAADLALVVENHDSFYRAATCLTLDMAYNNARQLARPDRDWLQP